LVIGGKRTAVLIQNQGLLNCINSLRAVGLDAGLPMLLVVGQFGREFDNVGQDPAQSRRRVVNLVEPMLDVMGIRIGAWMGRRTLVVSRKRREPALHATCLPLC
jgi:sulfopyruvate decarboxylase subunit alpha